MSGTESEHEAQQDAELRKLDPTYGEGEPAPTPEPTPAPDEPKRDKDGDLVYPFSVSGTLDAENENDAYKRLAAHFLALSRGQTYEGPSGTPAVTVTQV